MEGLLQACNYSRLVGPFYQVAGPAASMIAVSSGMLVTSAIAMLVVPDLVVAVVGLAAFTWFIFQTPCSPLPSIGFMGLLCVTAVFGKEATGKGAGSAATAAPASKAAGKPDVANKANGVKPPTPKKKRR